MPESLLTTLTCTYDETWWDDDGDDDPNEIGGFTDPANPWGGFRQELDPALVGEAFVAWREENVTRLTMNLWDAAEFVKEFPGGVWDYSEGDAEQQTNGRWVRVTLYVNEHAETVFAIADSMPG